jgi:hypothetical protein
MYLLLVAISIFYSCAFLLAMAVIIRRMGARPIPRPEVNQFHKSAFSAKGLARCNPLSPHN